MVEFEILNNFGSSLINLGIPIILLLFLAVIGVILYASGVLTKYPYKCILRIPRSGGGHKIMTVPGRSVKGGKMEIKFGWFDKLTVAEPEQAIIQEGDVIEGVMNSKEEVTWIKDIEINEAEMKFKAVVPENAQLTFAVVYDSAFQRTHKAKAWMQFAPYIALIVAAVILFGGMYVFGNMTKDGMMSYASAVDQNTHTMENATIVVYRTTAETGTSGFPNQPTTNPNAPPG